MEVFDTARSVLREGKTILKDQNKTTGIKFLRFAKPAAVFIMGGLLMHLLVMLIDYYLMIKPHYLNLHAEFIGGIFASPMLPMMGAYGLLSVVIYFLWAKKQKAMLLAHEKEIQAEKVETVLKSMQRITALLAEHLTAHNSQIMNWLEFKRKQGSPASEKVAEPCRKIAHTLQCLSEISFVLPYSEDRPEHVGDIEKILQGKIGKEGVIK